MQKHYKVVFFLLLLWGWINNNTNAQNFEIKFSDGSVVSQDISLLGSFKFPDNLLQVNYLSGTKTSYELSTVSTVYFGDTSTSIEDNLSSDDQEISVYPNPASDIIYLKNMTETGMYLSIYKIDGNLIQREIISDANQSVDISNLTKGIYIVRINNRTIKLIKE